MKKALAAAVAILSAATTATAQASRDSINASAQAWASVATNNRLRPLLSYSNEWGRYTQYEQGEGGIEAHVDYAHTFKNPSISFRAGVTAQASTDGDRTQLSELYADFDLWMFDIRMGLENYTPVESNTVTSVGSYIMSNNARPVPRGWVGILDYWSLPLDRLPFSFAKHLSELIQIRAGFSLGMMDDEGVAEYTDNMLLHEKFAYGRIGQWVVKPYVGLNHSVIMGGRLPDGTKVPIDFRNSVMAKNGDPSVFGDRFRAECTNAAGGHQGMWDCGLDLDFGSFSGKAYYQRPFADSKARELFPNTSGGHGAKDYTIGATIRLKKCTILREISVEMVKTAWQGGEGLPDPYVPLRNGSSRLFWPGDYTESNFDNIKNTQLIESDVEAWEQRTGEILNTKNFLRFCIDTYDHGESYGGRTTYLSNWLAEQGWTRHGLSMGNTLMHTKRTVATYAPDGTMSMTETFPNTQVRAINAGLAGDLVPSRLTYCLRLTFTRNYGNISEKYGDRNISWDEIPNYFFSTPKNEAYTKLDLNLMLRHGLSVNTNLAYDFGDLYHSFAIRAGVKYQIGLRL